MTTIARSVLRRPDYEREHFAVALLAKELADNPRNLLHALAEVARDLCDARTAGVNLLDGDLSRPRVIVGAPTSSPNDTLPPDQSTDMDCLQMPFHDHGTPVGTLWIIGHTVDRPFDTEDQRIVAVLATLASAGWHLWHAAELTAADGRRKDDFLATVAHELRNPLAAITAATAILQQTTRPPSASHALALITRQTQHMTRLISDLLDMARVASGKLELQMETLDLRTVVTQAVETRRGQIEHRSQALTVDLGDEPVVVNGDPVRLAQLISNLLDNASKYTPEHGDISVAVMCEAGQVSVAICDNGAGIPAEDTQRIFQPFTQLQNPAGSPLGGLGLGLTLVRTLAELHRGTISVVSAGVGQGSCFILRLPATIRLECLEGVPESAHDPSSRPVAATGHGHRACFAPRG